MTKIQWTIVGVLGVAIVVVFACVALLLFGNISRSFTPSIAEVVAATTTPIPPIESPAASLVTATPTLHINPTKVPSSKPTNQPDFRVQQSDVVIKDHRCVGKETDMTCVFTVQNIGNGVISSVYYDINVFDPQGITLRSSYVVFNNLFPGEIRKETIRLGVPENTRFGKYTVGAARISDLFANSRGLEANPFVVSNVEYKAGDYRDSVIAIVSNTSARTIKNAQVTAILYDQDGAFIGAGDTFAPMLLPRGKARVEIDVKSNGKVATVEVYPSLVSISTVSAEDSPQMPETLDSLPIPEGASLSTKPNDVKLGNALKSAVKLENAATKTAINLEDADVRVYSMPKNTQWSNIEKFFDEALGPSGWQAFSNVGGNFTESWGSGNNKVWQREDQIFVIFLTTATTMPEANLTTVLGSVKP